MKRGSPMRRSQSLTRAVFRGRRNARTPEETAGRQAVAKRSGGRCELDPTDPAQDVHHRKNRSQGGTWAVENLLHLCRRHHAHITTEPEQSRLSGWALRRTQNPALVPVVLHVGIVWLAADGEYLPHLPTPRSAS